MSVESAPDGVLERIATANHERVKFGLQGVSTADYRLEKTHYKRRQPMALRR
jgi:hypothetical protein